ncbi:MAG: hypothetical protein JWO25_2455, partial [Alphaproteobacteria bacterium]|nr:hypothetical protein [Alphaproteobacteria bacterium]
RRYLRKAGRRGHVVFALVAAALAVFVLVLLLYSPQTEGGRAWHLPQING